MNLRYLAIQETLQTLSTDELKKMHEEIDDMLSNRAVKAKKNFQDGVTTVTKIPEEGRDWIITFPEMDLNNIKMDLVVDWKNFYNYTINNQTIKCYYKLFINKKEMKMMRRIVCTCMSPISCWNNCYSKGKVLEGTVATFQIDEQTDKWQIKFFSNLIDLSEWLQKVFLLYYPIMKNIDVLYTNYFKDLNE